MQRALRLFAVFALAVSAFAFAIPASAVTPTACNGVPATIIGTTAAETLTGTPGDDVILGLGGADLIDGGAGNDLICGGHGDDTILGGDGDDTAYGYIGDDTIEGGMGNDTLFGGDGDDTLRGNEDNDVLVGGIGNDLLNGGYGDDTVRGNDGDDRAYGAPGNDRVEGGPGADYINGADGSDELYGHAGDDEIIGGIGDDLLFGGADIDTSNGGDGFDRCLGSENATNCEDDDLNDPPVAQDDEFTTDEDTTLNGDLLADNGSGPDDDPNADVLSAIAVDGDDTAIGVPYALPSGAEVTVDADGSFSYDPNGMFDHLASEEFEVDTFEYTISDPTGETDTALVTITIDGVNDAPVANDDDIGTSEDTPVSIDVLDNDTDVDSEISIASFTDPANGSVEEIEGELVYTPDENTFGEDTFTYTITDGDLTDTATVTVTVGSINDLPVAVDDLEVETDEDTPAAISVLDNDTDVEDDSAELTVAIVTEPENGTVQLVAGEPVYTPDSDYFGEDSFTYEVTDTDGGTSADTATVAINVLPINDAPVANDDDIGTSEDTPVSIDVLDNDTDVDSEISIASFTDPANGSVEEIEGELVYTPDENTFGEDTFTYTITDGDLTDTATVTVTVGSINDLPVAVDDLEVETDEDTPAAISVLDNDTDVEDDSAELTVAIVTEPENGTVQLVAGEPVYTPDSDYFGEDSFTYEVTDTDGGTSADTATVAINVLPINDAPVANDDDIGASEDDEIVFDDLLADNGSGPDFDVDGDELTVIAVNGIPFSGSYEETLANGTIEVSDNGEVAFMPGPLDLLGVGSSLADSFDYTLTDGIEVVTATVTVTVFGENDDPIGVDDGPYPTDEETAITIADLEANDTDPDLGDLVTMVDVAPTSTLGAALILYPDGSVLYDPVGALDQLSAGETAFDTFEYTVGDGNGGTGSATVTVQVTGINDTPVATDDTPTTDEDTTADIDVLFNDEDADDGAVLEVIALDFDTTVGTVSILPTNEVRYAPPLNFFGEDTFEYTMQDEHGAMSSATVTVTVGSVNDLPVANDDFENETFEDEALTIDVTANDTDVEDLPADLTPVVVIGPENGIVEVIAGEIVYTPEPDFWGPDGFEYKVVDLDSGESVELAFVEIFVIPVNDPPVAIDDLDVEAYEDEPAFIDVLFNDYDVDSPFWISDVTQPEHGWVDWGIGDLAANVEFIEDVLVYFPDRDYFGPDTFTYTITDGEFFSTATVTINVMPINDAPMPNDDLAETDEDIAVTIDVVANDEDIDNPKEDLTPIISAGPSFGDVEVIDGQILYTPDPDFNGEDSFWYYLNDGTDDSLWESLVIVTVHPVNDDPVAVDDLDVEAYEDEPAFIDVLFNDYDVDSPFWISDVTQPEHGWVDWGIGDLAANVEFIEDVLVYFPDRDYFGPDTFTYTITDGEFFSTATVTINVMPINDAPMPNDDLAETDEDIAVTIDVVANDEDIDNPKEDLTPIISAGPSFGDVEVIDGQILYTPDPDFNGEDSFWYYLNDGTDDSLWESLVIVTVHPVNDDPVAEDDAAEGSEDKDVWIYVLDNDYDIDEGDFVSIVDWTDPAHGTVTLGDEPLVGLNAIGGGFLVYTPDPNYFGPDSFEYTIADESGAQATATVEVFVESVNDLPVPFDDGPITTDEDTPVTIDVTANDEDVEDASNLLTPVVVEGPANGSTEVVNGQIVYTPDEDFSGNDGFWYVVFDTVPEESLAAAWVDIEVLEVNDDPIANDDSGEGFRMRSDESSFVTASVLDNDYDVDSGLLSVAGIDVVGTAGTVIPGPNGTFTYENTGGLGEGDTDSWLYRVIDGDGGESWAMVTININWTPIAGDDLIEAGEDDGEVSGSLLGNDSDADDDDLLVTQIGPIELSDGGWIIGTIVVDEFGDYTLTLDEGLNALADGETVSDTFMYGVDDGYGGAAMATVTVTVAGENDDPVAVPDFMVALDFGLVGNVFDSNDGPPDYDLDLSDSLFLADVPEGTPVAGGFLIELLGEGGPAALLIHTNGDVELLPGGAFDIFDIIDFTYVVSDGHGGTATASVTVIVDVFGPEV